MSGMRAHVIREGEYLSQIAARLGVSADTIWSHPKNAELRAKRSHMDVLHVGDVLFLPDVAKRPGLPLEKGTRNRYQGALPLVQVSLVLRDGGRVLADERYLVRGAHRSIEGVTDASGKLTIDVPITMRDGEILLPAKGLSFPIRLGDMDPITERTGVEKRLANLGLLHPSVDSTPEEALARALQTFQRLQGLDPTGEPNDETRRRLVAAYGC